MHCICADREETGKMVWDLKGRLEHRKPILVWPKQFHWFELVDPFSLLAVSNMKAVREVQQQGPIAWTFIINATVAIVSHPEGKINF